MAVDFSKIDRVDIDTLSNDFHVDNVIDYVHEGLKEVDKDYALELYRKFEKQRWSVYDLDFTQDRIDWKEKLTDAQRDTFLRVATGFHHGERQVAVDIVPIISAVPKDEHKVFLTSHLEDESRHTVFFDRFYREVVGLEAEDMMDTLDQSYEYMTETFVGSFGFLAYVVDQLRLHPDDKKLLATALTVYQMWIEGVLALSVMKITLSFCKENNVLPGFHKGFLATTRDESRHVYFGMKLLQEMLHEDPSLAVVVNDTLFTLLNMSSTYTRQIAYDPLGIERGAVREGMMRNLMKKVNQVGLKLSPELQKMIGEIVPEAAAGG